VKTTDPPTTWGHHDRDHVFVGDRVAPGAVAMSTITRAVARSDLGTPATRSPDLRVPRSASILVAGSVAMIGGSFRR